MKMSDLFITVLVILIIVFTFFLLFGQTFQAMAGLNGTLNQLIYLPFT